MAMGIESSLATPLALAVRKVGGQSAYARLTGRPQQTVHDRLRREQEIWAEDVLKVEAATGVSRHDLRPDLYPRESDATPTPEAA